MKKRSIKIEPVENGFFVFAEYQYKSNAKDSGHTRTEKLVATDEDDLFDVVSKCLAEPYVVIDNE